MARTFKLTNRLMRGEDIRGFQHDLNRILRKWDMEPQLEEDGYYGSYTRSVTASICHANGFEAGKLMAQGVTPWLRIKIRNYRRSAAERVRFAARVGYRRRLRARYAKKNVSPGWANVLADSWGYHPGVHDGIDIITPARAPVHAICDAEVVRVSPGGWWGASPSGDVALGDGIVIIRSLVDSGPIRKGMNLAYGHTEGATVKVGDRVRAGQMIGRAGLAVAYHTHFMVNMRGDVRGVGDRDPRPVYEHAQRS